MNAIDRLYEDFKQSAKLASEVGEISLQLAIENNSRKILLLGAASYFEYIICKVVEDFVHESASGNDMICSLVKIKAISRQYHTWFEWKDGNANKFYSLFGEKFKQHMKNLLKVDQSLEESVKSFMELGRTRNLLVHSDYASYLINKTSDEVYFQYLSAQKFVDVIGKELRNCASFTKVSESQDSNG